ncbi:MAG: extracellular solute-binding protein [Alphaproteobacteria bacterium]|nr:extracellular solute-binding protein [Alphaproteobacteria bacterium]
MTIRLSRRQALAAAGAALAVPSLARAQSADSLTYLGWSHTEAGSKPFLDGVFGDFKTANPNIRFETVGVPFGQMETTVFLRKRSSQRTDVIQMQERWLATFVAAGGMIDVDKIFGADFVDRTYHPNAVAMARVRGGRYGLPWVTGSTGFVVNNKLLAETGVRKPETMDELLDAMRKIKKAKPNSSPLGITTKNASLTQLETQLFFWQFGAKFFDESGKVTIDSPAARQALELLATMTKEGLIVPGNDRFDFRRLFAQELVAFYPDPPLARAFARAQSGQGEAYDRNIAPMATPVLRKGDDPVSIQWAHLLAFPDYGNAKPTADGAVGKFVAHLSKTETQLAYFKTAGVFPATKAALDTLASDSYVTDWIALSKFARPDEIAQFSNGPQLRDVIGEEVVAAMLGQKTASDAVSSMAKRLTEIGPKT